MRGQRDTRIRVVNCRQGTLASATSLPGSLVRSHARIRARTRFSRSAGGAGHLPTGRVAGHGRPSLCHRIHRGLNARVDVRKGGGGDDMAYDVADLTDLAGDEQSDVPIVELVGEVGKHA
jgi:hypothetical protein